MGELVALVAVIKLSAAIFKDDSFMYTPRFLNFEKYRHNKQAAHDGQNIIADSIVAQNPTLYNSYVVAGDYSYKNKDYTKALQYYTKALTLEIASAGEKRHVEEMIKKIEEQRK